MASTENMPLSTIHSLLISIVASLQEIDLRLVINSGKASPKNIETLEARLHKLSEVESPQKIRINMCPQGYLWVL